MLVDSYRRSFSYLRLSLLPVCNFRCLYCLPNGNPADALHKKHLSLEEIRRLVEGFSDLGISKIRLTGGEPTLRPDLLDVVSTISKIKGIKKIALTTNGYRLTELAKPLRKAGVTSLNVSIDSLKADRFLEITGQDRLEDVMEGVSAAKKSGFSSIKINVVALKGLNDEEIGDYLKWAQNDSIDIRFIELMPTKDTSQFFKTRHFDLSFLNSYLLERGWSVKPREWDAGPAEVWEHPKALGRVGFIRPYAKDFCESCNRLRVTSEGALQLCLFGDGTLPLRNLLQSDIQKEELKEVVLTALGKKMPSHRLYEGNYGTTRNFATMGG